MSPLAVAQLDALLAPWALIVAITAVCILLWIRTPIEPGFTGVLAIGGIGVVLSPATALTGFQSPATWLIAFGLLIGETTRKTGLASAVGTWLLARGVPDSATRARRVYLYTLTVLCLAGLLLTVFVPSSLVRVLVLAPIVGEAAKTQESEGAQVGLYLAPLITTFQSSVRVLTAGLPNVAVVGILESMTGATITWSEWAVLMFPVMGFGRAVCVVAVMYLLYRPSPGETGGVDVAYDGGLTDRQRRTLLYLGLGVLFWATDFAHGLHPLFGAVGVAVLAMAPRVGVVEFDTFEDVDFSILFFVGAVFAIAAALTEVGVTERVADAALAVLPPSLSAAVTLAGMFLLTVALQLFIESLAAVSVLTPIMVAYGRQVGLSGQAVVLVETIATVSLFFPYQSAVLVAILGQDVVGFRTIAKALVVCTVVGTVVLLPLQLGYLSLFMPI